MNDTHNKNIKIAKPKGRPMLTWVGKQPLKTVRAYPAQLVEEFEAGKDLPLADADWSDWPEQYPRGCFMPPPDKRISACIIGVD